MYEMGAIFGACMQVSLNLLLWWLRYVDLLYLSIVGLMRALWVQDHSVRKWILPRPCEIFCAKYDNVQEQIRQISCMDDLLSGEWYVWLTSPSFFMVCVCINWHLWGDLFNLLQVVHVGTDSIPVVVKIQSFTQQQLLQYVLMTAAEILCVNDLVCVLYTALWCDLVVMVWWLLCTCIYCQHNFGF